MDAVKKRAVRTVGSYEEFKNLVACAHLRPLSRKDIQSVPQRTQGWTTTSSAGGKIRIGGGGGNKGEASEISPGHRQAKSKKTTATNPSSSSSPSSSSTTYSATSPLAFERDWQRLVKAGKSSQEKLSFFRSAGGASFIHRSYIMGKKRREMSADVLGDLLVVLREGLKEEEESRGGEGCRDKKKNVMQEEGEMEEGGDAMTAGTSINALEILHALAQIDRFQITLALLSEPQLEAAREIVEKEEENREEGRRQRLEEVRRLFSFSAGGKV